MGRKVARFFDPLNATWIADRFRLLMRAIDARAACAYGDGETPYPYCAPATCPVAWPQAGEAVNLRPALGYNKYF